MLTDTFCTTEWDPFRIALHLLSHMGRLWRKFFEAVVCRSLKGQPARVCSPHPCLHFVFRNRNPFRLLEWISQDLCMSGLQVLTRPPRCGLFCMHATQPEPSILIWLVTWLVKPLWEASDALPPDGGLQVEWSQIMRRPLSLLHPPLPVSLKVQGWSTSVTWMWSGSSI